MKKSLVRRRSGRDMYVPKWQNMESTSYENEDGDDALHSASTGTTEIAQTTAAPLAVTETNSVTPEGVSRRRICLSNSHDSMYRATLDGDCVAVEMLLEGHPNLASDEISEEGDRSLHIAAAIKHQEIVQKLVEKMSPTELTLLDGNGYTACCYAAISGVVDIVDLMIRKNSTLSTARDRENKTPLYKAAFRGNAKMVSYLLKYAKAEELSTEEWFDLLLLTIRREMYGVVDIVDLMIRKNSTLSTARDRENKTPLYKAAFRGNAKMVSYLLKYAKAEELSTEEWFDLLLLTIRREMYDLALEICGNNEQLATMRNDEGTALHLLAKQLLPLNRNEWYTAGLMRQEMSLLAKKLWEGIQRLGQASALELIKNPPVLHDATEVGNVELITMITHTYPHLVWHTNSEGYTIFHIAVKYQRANLFGLIEEIGARKDLIAASQDENGNNILHLAAKLGSLDQRVLMLSNFRLHWETMWFKEVEAMVPVFCSEMRNNEGYTPKELFTKEHKSLLEKNATWTKNTADSWLLISTLIFSVMFTSAFAVPGGYNQETGIPILFKSIWFTYFVAFEALAMFCSAFSVLQFSSTMMAIEANFFDAYMIKKGLHLLSLSIFGAFSVFISAYFLVYEDESPVLITSLIIISYISLVFVLLLQNSAFHRSLSSWFLFPKRSRHSLFKRHGDTVGENKRRRRWIF